MKLMMNGALTVGTRDGATLELAEEAGGENLYLFDRTAEQVAHCRAWFNLHWHYEHELETRQRLAWFSLAFSRNESGVFAPVLDTLLTNGDLYMHPADVKSHLEADQRLVELYCDRDAWSLKATLNVASSGEFSTDRTIAEYAAPIWNADSCPVS
ncbi:MAG TPA: glycogen/starch/alpha-glucan phosphorylase [Gemmataceae bacterium]|jgi:starch phosphorylase|nr:glycogen/starch/alpha-glucan phosphorylase [Gemmataceae bacterium]